VQDASREIDVGGLADDKGRGAGGVNHSPGNTGTQRQQQQQCMSALHQHACSSHALEGVAYMCQKWVMT
jgi:hypothetical protein